MSTEFEAVIGLEVHVQLSTETKIFCDCPAKPLGGGSVSDVQANAYLCPVCAGHPGTLPVLNRKVLEYAAKAGLALSCTVNLDSRFDRKNYFYADLPKGYQITQYARPICEWGSLSFETPRGLKTVQIRRIHLEEDAGKSVHEGTLSLINLNRAGVPLIEIVTEPDFRQPDEAAQYLRELHAIVTAVDISDGNLQEGNFRCDSNVSVRPRGSQKLGTRVEIKNVNSFRFVEKAIEYEIARQIEVLNSGGRIIQETRTFDSDRGVTLSMRTKEEAEDYRYFPDPDLTTAWITADQLQRWKNELPELPQAKRKRYQSEWGLTTYDAELITGQSFFVSLFEAALSQLAKEERALAKSIAHFLTGEVAKRMNEEAGETRQPLFTAQHLVELARLVRDEVVSSAGAKQAIYHAWGTGDSISDIVEKQGLKQVSDTASLEPIVEQVLLEFAAQFEEFKSGKEKVIGFLVGQIMKRSGGKANPALVQQLIRKRVNS
jgi:aspartyl-tRNA(Asn)/glutamyl-tRNA(Gln) amidotransferase subunit B